MKPQLEWKRRDFSEIIIQNRRPHTKNKPSIRTMKIFGFLAWTKRHHRLCTRFSRSKDLAAHVRLVSCDNLLTRFRFTLSFASRRSNALLWRTLFVQPTSSMQILVLSLKLSERNFDFQVFYIYSALDALWRRRQ